MSYFHIALAVSGHLDITIVDRGRFGQIPLFRGQIHSENARCHMETTVKAGDRLAEVTVKPVSTAPFLNVHKAG